METKTAYIVAAAGDPGDWVASFRKSPGFPARDWARRMAALYNQDLAEGAHGPDGPVPPGSSFHPEAAEDSP